MLLLIATVLIAAAALAAVRVLVFVRVAREVDSHHEHDEGGVIVGAQGYAAGSRDSESAVLLLHGFGDTPQSMRELGEALGASGHYVEAPLLAGHGCTVRSFAKSRARDWERDAFAAFRRLASTHSTLSVVGQSMGGALSVLLASEGSASLAALVLLSPYLAPSRTVARIARWPVLTSIMAPIIGSRAGTASIHDSAARAASLGYGVTTARLLHELVALANRANSALPAVKVPTLYVQSRQDNRISPVVAKQAFQKLGAADKKLEWLEHSGHVIAADAERARVIAAVEDWLRAHIQRS